MSTLYGRIVLIGESQVGKTSLIQHHLHGSAASQSSTVGAVFHTYKRAIAGIDMTLQIWDTAGQERYRALGPIYYRKSIGAIAVFDLTRPNTMEKLSTWIAAFREHADDPFVVIVANKCDQEAEMTVEQTVEFAKQYNASCIWASAVTGEHVSDVFDEICEHLTHKEMEAQTSAIEKTSVNLTDHTEVGGGCSC
jgi:small GTP-binding protein